MKIRLTLGNIIGVVTGAAAFIVAHDQIINLVANSVGGKLAVVSAIALTLAKGIVSGNTDQIPEEKKAVDTKALVVEKTTVLKP